MAGAVRRVGLAVEPPESAHLRPAWPPANPPTRPTSPRQVRPRRRLHLGRLGRVRRPKPMYPSIVQARPIMLDCGTTPGCLPTPRGAARGRLDCTVDLLAILRGHAQVPDLTVDCIIRPRRRRRRRLSGGGSQTGQSGSRTAQVCPSPARVAARQPSDPTDLSPAGAHGDRYTWVG